MNQYQRMICYLYEYNKGQKGANVGYVRLEQRGERCRVQIQMRGRNLETPPVAAFFKQENTGISLLQIGDMQEGKGELYCRVESNTNNLLESNHTLEEMDGIFLYVSEALYFASSWKLQDIFVGSLSWWERRESYVDELPVREQGHIAETDVAGVAAIQEETMDEMESSAAVQENTIDGMESKAAVQENIMDGAENSAAVREDIMDGAENSAAVRENIMDGAENSAAVQENITDGGESIAAVQERERTGEELEAQTVCECCPFKRKELDFGKRMLLTFPLMKPFGGRFEGPCVRIEPQDLGCLPMRYWSLSGNVFLMQGYYNFRHLIFMEKSEGEYAIGVPGIYSDITQEQGKKAGFSEFLAICGQRNCRGAFGYWLMSL